MLDEREQDALFKIKAYLDAGHTYDSMCEAGWGPWIDHLEAKGYDLRTGYVALRAPKLALKHGTKTNTRRSSGRSWRQNGAAIAVVVVVLVIIGALFGDGGSVSVGDEARVYEEGLTTITVGVDTSAFNAIQDALFAKDSFAIDEMILSGRAYTISNGTRALVLDRTLTRTKVRFLEGPHRNRVGHVLTDWVRPD